VYIGTGFAKLYVVLGLNVKIMALIGSVCISHRKRRARATAHALNLDSYSFVTLCSQATLF
jgi:hypothetical protein